MFGIRRTRPGEHVDPDLPITPMLDMSFQLMAFFIFTFRPAPTEAQLMLALPKSEGDPTMTAPPDPFDPDKPVNLVVSVLATESGTIAGMTITEAGGVDARPADLGADVKKYQAELRKHMDAAVAGKKKKPKLTLKIANALLWEYVVQLIDLAAGLQYEDIAPMPLEPKKT